MGISYERYSKNPDDATINQGLVGRGTGYDDNGISIYYTNIDSIERYEKLWNSNFEDKTIKWNSKTTKYKNGTLSGKNTFNDPNNYNNFLIESNDIEEIKEPIIKKFKTQKEAKEYYKRELKQILGGRGPNERNDIDENGFYLSSSLKIKKVRTTQEIYDIRKWSLDEKHRFTFYPCYENINDNSTIQWWLIHY